MAEEAAELVLEGISTGVDKVPDRHWEKIPGLKPKQKERLKSNNDKDKGKDKDRKNKQSSRQSKRRSPSPSGSDSESSKESRGSSRAQDRPREARSSNDDGPYNYQTPDRAYYDYSQQNMGDSYYPQPPQGDYQRRYIPSTYQPRNDENQQSYAAQGYGREQYVPVCLRCCVVVMTSRLTMTFQGCLR